MVLSTAAVTVTWSVPLIAPSVAVSVACPAATALAWPALAPVATTARMLAALDDQVACWVTSL